MNIFHALILGVVEGITEFLPISSTAHLLFAARLLGLEQTPFLSSFEIAIQLGAIAAVALVVWRRVFGEPRLIALTVVGFIPTAIIGATVYHWVKELLAASPLIPILTLGLGGIALIVFEQSRRSSLTTGTPLPQATYKQALITGLSQTLAFVPGVSRSAASVVGGMFAGLDRKAAVELSFLLAIPTMAAATGLDLLKTGFVFTTGEWELLAVGLVASFVTALVVVRWLLRYIESHTFASFGVYRIIAAIILAFVLL
jgi:undecaprenyl-diphosphatase